MADEIDCSDPQKNIVPCQELCFKKIKEITNTPFFEFKKQITEGERGVFKLQPMHLFYWLELLWRHGEGLYVRNDKDKELLKNIVASVKNSVADGTEYKWNHLIYAYMIENTRIYEIFRRVLYEFLHGEKLGVPADLDTQYWLRNTEELFFREPLPFYITSITSQIRSDMGATRRNAYWRMFGMDLNHGTDDGQPYSYIKADASNNEFVTTFEEFLREVWVAIANKENKSGANPTDNTKIQNLAIGLKDMLNARKLKGNLLREEFASVSMMSWFRLTIDDNYPIIQSLNAQASSPEQRLFKIAQRVGLPAHGHAKSYFDIAEPISRILILIEDGGLDNLPSTPTFPFADNVSTDLNIIITHWSIITGRDVKAGKVAAT